MPAERVPMKKVIEVLRLKFEAGLSHEKISRACGISKGAVSHYVCLAKAKGVGWPLPEGTDEVALEALLFPVKHRPVPRLVEPDYFQTASRAQAQGCDPATAVGRVCRGLRGEGLSLQPVLQSLPSMAGPAETQHAPATPGRREGLHRLRRANGPDCGLQHRRMPFCPDLCRRARCLELHLCRGHLYPVCAGLDCAHQRMLRSLRGAGTAGTG